jgi:hypothetical protein
MYAVPLSTQKKLKKTTHHDINQIVLHFLVARALGDKLNVRDGLELIKRPLGKQLELGNGFKSDRISLVHINGREILGLRLGNLLPLGHLGAIARVGDFRIFEPVLLADEIIVVDCKENALENIRNIIEALDSGRKAPRLRRTARATGFGAAMDFGLDLTTTSRLRDL